MFRFKVVTNLSEEELDRLTDKQLDDLEFRRKGIENGSINGG